MAKKTSSSRTGKGTNKVAKKTRAPAAKQTTKKTSKAAKKKMSKVAAKKTTPKKAAAKKPAPAAKKKIAKRTPTKTTAKPTKKVTKKAESKKTATKKPAASKTTNKKVSSGRAASSKAPAAVAAKDSAAAAGAKGRKGITIVPEKPRRPPRRSRPKAPETRRPVGSQLLGPGSPKRSPLIPSGPKAPKAEAPAQGPGDGKLKSPFKKRELDKFKNLLLNKRRALVGDVSQLETEALRNSSGSSSHTPQHMAEQGSDSADQSLSLGLAAADRRLIKEIDAALQRISEGRFGICELSGRAIRAERLKELPWARYSIEAARQRERNMFRGNW